MASLSSDDTSSPSVQDCIVDDGIVHHNGGNTFQHSHRVTNMTMMELLMGDVSSPHYQDSYAFHDVSSNEFLEGNVHTLPGDVMRSAGAGEANEPIGVGVEGSVHDDNGITFQHSHRVTNMTMMELLVGVPPPPFHDYYQMNDMELVMETEKESEGDIFPELSSDLEKISESSSWDPESSDSPLPESDESPWREKHSRKRQKKHNNKLKSKKNNLKKKHHRSRPKGKRSSFARERREMNSRQLQFHNGMATVIQRVGRGYLASRNYRFSLRAATVIQRYFRGYLGFDNYRQGRRLFAAFLASDHVNPAAFLGLVPGLSTDVQGTPSADFVQHMASAPLVRSMDGGLPSHSSSSLDSLQPQQEEDSVVSENGEMFTPHDGQTSSFPENSSPQQQQEVNVDPEYEEIVFPDPIYDGNQDFFMLFVKCALDVDSIYFKGSRASLVLQAIGGNGACRFNSSANRVSSTNSSRLAADYRENAHLMPHCVGNLRQMKVIAVHHFHNTRLCMVTKDNVPFTVSLFLHQGAVIGRSNYVHHNFLLTIVAALNIAIDGNIPFDPEDVFGRMINDVEDPEWTTLNYFELQDNSVIQKVKMHDSHMSISSECGAMLFYRYERALELMASSPSLIDPDEQDLDSVKYWCGRQGLLSGGSGNFVPLPLLSKNAAVLLDKTFVLATAAGIKKIFHYDGKQTWAGLQVHNNVNWEWANNRNWDREAIMELWRTFQRQEFVKMKRSLVRKFSGLEESDPLFKIVTMFFDVGLEIKPYVDLGGCLPFEFPNHQIPKDLVILPHLQRSKEFLRSLGRSNDDIPDNLSLISDESVDDDEILVDNVGGEGVDSDELLVETEDNRAAFNRFNLTSYPKHFTTCWGNIHSGSARLNAVEDLDSTTEKVVLILPSQSHFLGGQLYTHSNRLKEMAMTRPQRSRISSITAHVKNICTDGGFLNCSVIQSMERIDNCLKLMNEIFENMRARRRRETQNVVRFEYFLVYNNDGIAINNLPYFDPQCLDLFSKSSVNEFEDKVLSTHFSPINKLFGQATRMAEMNLIFPWASLEPCLRTRIVASLEILNGYFDDSLSHNGVIQSNLRRMNVSLGITRDIPCAARVPLSARDKERTGFFYGVLPKLLPLISEVEGLLPPLLVSGASEGYRSTLLNFPVFFSAADRAVSRSLCNGNNDGMLQGLKAQMKALIIYATVRANGDVQDLDDFGLMEDIDYESLVACDATIRLSLLEQLSRLLIIAICQSAWKELVAKVFGVNPIFDGDLDLARGGHQSQQFEDFPFTEHKIAGYLSRVEGTLFCKRGIISSTGKY